MAKQSPSSRRAGEIQTGMFESTTRIEVYCQRDHKATWQEEAEEEGYSSASQYLYDLIQEARAYRQGGLSVISTDNKQVQKLEHRIQQLQEELKQARAHQTNQGARITVSELVEQSLSKQCQSLDELVEQASATDEVRDHLRRRIEDHLYSLAENGTVEFQRGHGWRFKGGQ